MSTVEEIIEEVQSLPVEMRAQIAASLLEGLNAPRAEVDRKWIEEAKRRREELRSGKVKAVPGEEVFGKIRERFNK